MISDKVLEDAKFYGKLIALEFTKDSMDEGINNIINMFENKIIKVEIDAGEYLQYAIRLTGGRYPTVTILTPDLRVLAILDSKEGLYDKIREVIDLYKFKGFAGAPITDFVPVPIEPDPSLFFNTINSLLKGYPVDLRGMEVFNTYCNVYKEYRKILDKMNVNSDVIASLGKGVVPDSKYTAVLSLQTYYGLRKINEILDLVNDEGEVFRSKRKENKGLLIDEAYMGSTLVNEWERTGDEKYLNLSLKIADFVLRELKHEKGFMDSKRTDKLTEHLVLEPLANAETAIFFAKLYAALDDSVYADASRLAMASANGGAPHSIEVQERIMCAYMKINEGIRSNDPSLLTTDCRIEIPRHKPECRLKQDDKCYEDVSLIQFKSF